MFFLCHHTSCLGEPPWATCETYGWGTSIDVCKQNKQKYLLLKMCRSLCPWTLQPFEEEPPSVLLSHLTEGWTGGLRGHRPSHSHPCLSTGAGSCTQAATSGDPQLAGSGRAREVMGLHCSQGKHHLQGPELLQARCSAAALHLSPIPTVCSNTPAWAPCAEDMNASPSAWPCTMPFLSL